MKNVYIKTNWVDNRTPVNAANLNKIEGAISDLYNTAIAPSDIKPGEGISVTPTSDKGVEIAVSKLIQRSSDGSCPGLDIVFSEPVSPEKDRVYLVLDPDTKTLKKIAINGVIVFSV